MRAVQKLKAEVFQPDYIPQEVVDREQERQQIKQGLEAGLDIYITGPTGTGKTLVLKKQKESSSSKTVYINALKTSTLHQGVMKIFRQVGNPLNVFSTGTPTSETINKLEKKLKTPITVILDEPEKLKDGELLKYLLDNQNIQLLMASSNEDFLSNLSDETGSRVKSCHKVEFSKYTDEELLQIARNRAREAGKPEKLTEEAEKLVRTCEDARTALSIVEKSLKGLDISDNTAPSTPKDEFDLNQAQQVLLDIIQEQEEIKPKELYQEFENRFDGGDRPVNRTLRKYLKELARLDLIEAEGSGRWRKYRLL